MDNYKMPDNIKPTYSQNFISATILSCYKTPRQLKKHLPVQLHILTTEREKADVKQP